MLNTFSALLYKQVSVLKEAGRRDGSDKYLKSDLHSSNRLNRVTGIPAF